MKLVTKLSEFKKIQENDSIGMPFSADGKIDTNDIRNDIDSLEGAPNTVKGKIDLNDDYSNLNKHISDFNKSIIIEEKYGLAKSIIRCLNTKDNLDQEDDKLFDRMIEFISSIDKIKTTIIPPRRRVG